ncbi:cytochrome P450 [Coniophora puteana RWD-64-598 SS2]|uniref:Cytochrome P450 n=1 Tax=Coniophora puteana (strain RWD-64-598) TaxID=741705 RepID=A0A5M3M658_CONPW|nr:cytochrome P450 [Coniophora puteana RWD-64-598 SS2]EIW74862.1 cytochrome P450 [Coniophora puteana RWD-64-598 SS2]
MRSAQRPSEKSCTIPGPEPWPLLGNIPGIDAKSPWLSYMNWSKTYGGIFLTTALGFNTVIISDEKIAHELLDIRSSKYSARFFDPTGTFDAYGFESLTALMGHSNEWRTHRRIFHQHFRADAAREYRDMQLHKVAELVRNILASPQDYREHLEAFASSTIVAAVYGYQARPVKDPLVQKMTHRLEGILKTIGVEKIVAVNFMPFLQYVPSWLPGGSVNAAVCRESIETLSQEPFASLNETIPESSVPSVGYSGITRQAQLPDGSENEDQHLVKDVCSSAFAAGVETTASTLYTFVLAMVLHPEAQARAYADIVRACGADRIPTFEDREDLPYIDAILRETERWYPVLPLGLPHSVSEDDTYGDYFIPKGTTFMVNIWALCHDEERFPRPDDFLPERFLAEDGTLVKETVDLVFGFGRRVCPGRHFADASLWVAIAALLSTFRFERANGAQGTDIPFDTEWASGATLYVI